MIKLILADMDGTLLDDQKRMPKNTFEVINKCFEQGIIFGVASGRQMRTLQLLFPKIGKKMLFIAENGAYSSYLNETIFFSKIEDTYIKKIINDAKKLPDVFPILCGKDCAYVDSNDPRLLKECDEYYKSCKVVNDLFDVDDDICKVAICDFNGAEHSSYPIFSKYSEDLQVTLSGQIWVDISNLGLNKGKSVMAIQEKLGISKEESMAFGDYLNDVSLLDEVEYSYAMKNAHPDLLKHAHYLTKWDNNEGGVIKTIEELI